MCQIMEELVEKRAQKERQKGRLEGINLLIAAYRKLGMSDEQIIEQIASEYKISKKEVALYVYAE